MVTGDPHMHRFDACPDGVAGRSAVGEQHIGCERRFVGGLPGRLADYTELLRDPAFMRQRALEIFADHALIERRAGEQPVERGAVQLVQRSGGVRRRWQRERQEKVKVWELGCGHDAAHCMAKDPRFSGYLLFASFALAARSAASNESCEDSYPTRKVGPGPRQSLGLAGVLTVRVLHAGTGPIARG